MAAQVAMVFKMGGDYNLEYVRRLADSAKRYGAEEVVCLSDCPNVRKYAKYIPLRNGWPGWWSKLELFYLTDKTVYFDLDTIIRGSLRPILDYPHQFTMLRGFYTRTRGASGVMAWEGDYSHIPAAFDPDTHMSEYTTRDKWGDQGFIYERLPDPPDFFQDKFPRKFASRKADRYGMRREATVVCYHGLPRPHHTGWAI